MPPETSWEQLAGMYDGFIFDQFGVMHNGAVALEGAPALVDRLAAAGKKLGILSNSSKRKEWTLRELPKLKQNLFSSTRKWVSSKSIMKSRARICLLMPMFFLRLR